MRWGPMECGSDWIWRSMHMFLGWNRINFVALEFWSEVYEKPNKLINERQYILEKYCATENLEFICNCRKTSHTYHATVDRTVASSFHMLYKKIKTNLLAVVIKIYVNQLNHKTSAGTKQYCGRFESYYAASIDMGLNGHVHVNHSSFITTSIRCKCRYDNLRANHP